MWRYEIKYALWDYERPVFDDWLHGGNFFHQPYPDRWVNSVYLDTPDFLSARDNLAGIANREKYRLRWYGDSQRQYDVGGQFEIKIKQGRVGRKVSASLECSPYDLQVMDQQGRDKLLSSSGCLAPYLPVFAPLRPCMGIRYHRTYYQGEDDIRLTIDRNVLFAGQMPGQVFLEKPFSSYDKLIIEFKFSADNKEKAAELMASLPFYPVRSSKYMLGHSLLGSAVYI